MSNLKKITVNGVTFHFSYTTLVAIEDKDHLIVHENIWSRTSGKHLTQIDGGNHANLVKSSLFNDLVRDVCINHEINEVPTVSH